MSQNPSLTIHSTAGNPWTWHDRWIKPPVPEFGVRNQRTHGIGFLEDGRIVLFHQALPSLLILSPKGDLLARWGSYPGAHGLTIVRREGKEHLWLTDEFLGVAELVDLKGRVVRRLSKPDHPAYQNAPFVPTWVAEESEGGKPVRLWLSDGYGSHLVHAYDGEGNYQFSLDGTEGAGKFDCPHSVAIDPRPGKDQRVLVADRGNHRVQEFDRDGRFLGSWGQDFFHSPNGFDFRDGRVAVSELFGCVSLLDENNQLVERLGNQANARHLPGWPLVDPAHCLVPGLFNSPHHAAWEPGGSLVAVEWIKHGRVTRLTPGTASNG